MSKDNQMNIYLTTFKRKSEAIKYLILSIIVVEIFFIFNLTLGFISTKVLTKYYMPPSFDLSLTNFIGLYIMPLLFFPFWVLLHFRVFEYLKTKKTISLHFISEYDKIKSKKYINYWIILLLLSYSHLLIHFFN